VRPTRAVPALLALVLATALAVAAPAAAARSPFAWRGIVEGSYGRAWTHAERLRMLDWMARHGMNAYVHAPKDDLLQRAYWRDPYPRRVTRDLAAEVRRARARGIAWIANLSPALPLIPSLEVSD